MPHLNAWWDDAACKDVDPDIFVPKNLRGGRRKDGAPPPVRDWKEARAVCAGCPVIEDCLNYTLQYTPTAVHDGVYDALFVAGRTPEELMQLRRRKDQLERGRR